MPTEREKMLAGELYDAMDPELVAARGRARDLCQTLNATGVPSSCPAYELAHGRSSVPAAS
jgi:hypothetical protein